MLIKLAKHTSIESTGIIEVFISLEPNSNLEPGDKPQEAPLAIVYTKRNKRGYRLNGNLAKAFIFWHDQNCKDLLAIYEAMPRKSGNKGCDHQYLEIACEQCRKDERG